ncbi:MAG TPA: hypothetical protein VK190_03280 [Pseudoneobacillus sp.]|jgi:hypothetical protein|nr:hypothetical protein [Pseudoneobacillus sp.]
MDKSIKGAGAKGLSVGSVLGHVANAGMMAFSVASDMKEGDSLGKAVFKEAGMMAFMMGAPTVFWGYQAAQLGGAIATGIYNLDNQKTNWFRQNTRTTPQFNYVDTQAAYTMRSAAVQAIQGSKLNARSALGGEARLLARREAYNSI